MNKSENTLPEINNHTYKVEIIDKNNDNWYEKYSTALSIFFSALLTICGWVMNNRYIVEQQKVEKFLEIKNEKLYNAYKDIQMYNSMREVKSVDKETALKYSRSIIDIQVYGTERQIELAKSAAGFYVNTENSSITKVKNLDTLLNEIRNDLRKDFNLIPVRGGNFWTLDPKAIKKQATE